MDQYLNQAVDVRLPLRQEVVCQTVDGTARSYDTSVLKLDGQLPRPKQDGNLAADLVFVRIANDGANDMWIQASETQNTDLDDTNLNGVGVAWTSATQSIKNGVVIKSGTYQDFHLNRQRDRWLCVKCSGSNTTTMSLYTSSGGQNPRGAKA